MRIDKPRCRHQEMKRFCKHYEVDGNCRLNITDAKAPCEKYINEILEAVIKQAKVDYPSQPMTTHIPHIMICSIIEIFKKGGIE